MSGFFVARHDGPYGTEGDAMSTVAEMYLPVAVMTLVGIGFPVGSFIAREGFPEGTETALGYRLALFSD